jgi:hypothetical protein
LKLGVLAQSENSPSHGVAMDDRGNAVESTWYENIDSRR